MPGLANTNKFLLSSASVMIGAMADLHDMVPDSHGIGLIKNFSVTNETGYTDLTQGVKGSLVFSTLTSSTLRASMEVYEYTAKNISYALGLNGSGVTAQTVSNTVATAITSTPTTSLVLTSATGFTAGDYVLIESDAVSDKFLIRKIASIASQTLTLDKTVVSVPLAAKVYKVNSIDLGSKVDQPFLAAKITGKLADGSPVVFLFPKIRVTKGFEMAFNASDYANMPFEFTMYDLTSADAEYANFPNKTGAMYLQ
jgi:hypothetical protein